MPDRVPVRVTLVLATSTGGVGRHVRSLAAYLVAEGCDVLVCGPAATEELFDFTGCGAHFQPVEIPASLAPVRDGQAIRVLRAATAAADVVHSHGHRATLVAALARRGRSSQPQVATWHNLVLGRGAAYPLRALMERFVARSAEVTLAASEDLAARALVLGAADVRLAPVAAPARQPARRDRDQVRAECGAEDRPLVLSVGRLHPQKQFDVLITAAARWGARDPAPRVVIAGDGPSGPALRRLAAHIAAPVTFLGHRTDIADLLEACDVAVVTSAWEARQLFAQEALQAGRPLVATAVGGLPGLLRDGALLVPSGDVDALEQAVGRMLDTPAEAARLGERGRALAATWPSETDTARQVAAVYAELLGLPEWRRVER